MNWETNFFRWVWRFNAVALAAVLVVGGLLALVGLVSIILEATRERDVSDLVDHRPEASKTVIEAAGRLTPLGRTGLLWAPVTRESEAALVYSSKQVSATVDYVFYDPETGSSRMLIGKRPSLVASARMLRPPQDDGDPAGDDLALLVTLVEEDGNKDGRLSLRDPISLALASPRGENLAVVAKGSSLLGVATVSDTLAIATIREETESGPRTIAVHLDLATRRATRREPLPNAPP